MDEVQRSEVLSALSQFLTPEQTAAFNEDELNGLYREGYRFKIDFVGASREGLKKDCGLRGARVDAILSAMQGEPSFPMPLCIVSCLPCMVSERPVRGGALTNSPEST
jgi:hypothetical protein